MGQPAFMKRSDRLLSWNVSPPFGAWISLAFVAFATLPPINETPPVGSDSFLHLFSNFDHYIAFAVVSGQYSKNGEPVRSEAIRRLVELGLKVKGK
jgi:hypothetical protein